jgi:NAD(P)H-dependent FMN reductase
MARIGIIIGSTRPGCNGEAVARWVFEKAQQRTTAEYELIDLADFGLPHLDEAPPPAMGQYAHEHTKNWADTIARFDGYILVTPEYNHSTSGALKNAIDFLGTEWYNKVAGFVGYGVYGGVRAIVHLRLVFSQLQVATVSAAATFNLMTDFENMSTFRPAEYHEPSVTAQGPGKVVAWGSDLRVCCCVTGVACVTGMAREAWMEVLTLTVQPENHTRPCHLLAPRLICLRHSPIPLDRGHLICSRPSPTREHAAVGATTRHQSSR